MSGGKHRSRNQVIQQVRKGVLLSADERSAALRMRRQRFNTLAIARAIGRSVPDVQAFLDSPEAQLG